MNELGNFLMQYLAKPPAPSPSNPYTINVPGPNGTQIPIPFPMTAQGAPQQSNPNQPPPQVPQYGGGAKGSGGVSPFGTALAGQLGVGAAAGAGGLAGGLAAL